MYISPYHNVPAPQNFGLVDQIEIFAARIDGWHLEVADRCINGWKNPDGIDCIQTTDLQGRNANYIPDSGWAVLQIVLNYFEVVGEFKQSLSNTQSKNMRSREKFSWGYYDVFPEHKGETPDIAQILWEQLRTSLYHTSVKDNRIVLSHKDDIVTISYDSSNDIVIIDPHNFIKRLRSHFNDYINQLKDTAQTQMRDDFAKAYKRRYSI